MGGLLSEAAAGGEETADTRRGATDRAQGQRVELRTLVGDCLGELLMEELIRQGRLQTESGGGRGN